MNKIAKHHVGVGLIYLIVGLAIGIIMAKTGDYTQRPTHAHVLLLGLVISMLYGVIYKLWLDGPASLVARIQFWTHQIGILGIVVGLYCLYSGSVPADKIGPVLGIFSILALLGAVLMTFLFFTAKDPA